jgi:hypothetical protein
VQCPELSRLLQMEFDADQALFGAVHIRHLARHDPLDPTIQTAECSTWEAYEKSLLASSLIRYHLETHLGCQIDESASSFN